MSEQQDDTEIEAHVIFRFLGDEHPPHQEPIHWQADLYDMRYDSAYPIAIAWLSDFSACNLGVVLDMMLVPDRFRRKGYATVLIKACNNRWSNLVITDPISKAGEGLLKRLEREGVVTPD